jgi:hypothetical protein
MTRLHDLKPIWDKVDPLHIARQWVSLILFFRAQWGHARRGCFLPAKASRQSIGRSSCIAAWELTQSWKHIPIFYRLPPQSSSCPRTVDSLRISLNDVARGAVTNEASHAGHLLDKSCTAMPFCAYLRWLIQNSSATLVVDHGSHAPVQAGPSKFSLSDLAVKPLR